MPIFNPIQSKQTPPRETNNEYYRIIIATFSTLIILLTIISSIIIQQKNKQMYEEDSKLIVENDQEEQFILENLQNGDTKTLTLRVVNKTVDEKKYKIKLKDVQNELEDTSNLTYDLFINGKQEIIEGIFPKQDTILITEASIPAISITDIKIVLTYKEKTKEDNSQKIVTGKIVIEEII